MRLDIIIDEIAELMGDIQQNDLRIIAENKISNNDILIALEKIKQNFHTQKNDLRYIKESIDEKFKLIGICNEIYYLY